MPVLFLFEELSLDTVRICASVRLLQQFVTHNLVPFYGSFENCEQTSQVNTRRGTLLQLEKDVNFLHSSSIGRASLS